MPAGLFHVVYDFHCFSVKVETVDPSVNGPALLQCFRFIGGGNAEFRKCDDHRPNAHIGFGGWTNVPAPWTSDDGSTNSLSRADVMQHGIEFISQIDDLGKREVRAPSATEFSDHLGKPGSLCIARRHLRLIVPASRRFRPHPQFSDNPCTLQSSYGVS
jgi:hypothetical protein